MDIKNHNKENLEQLELIQQSLVGIDVSLSNISRTINIMSEK